MQKAIILVAWLTLLAFAIETKAEEESRLVLKSRQLKELPTEQVGDKINALIKKINNTISTGDRYLAAMKDASKEDRLLIELHLIMLQNNGFDAAQQLADALLVLEKKAPAPDLRRQIEDIYTEAAPRFINTIDRLRDRIDAIRADRLEEDITKRYEIESVIKRYTMRVDELFEMNYRLIEKMKKLGMDTQTYEEALAKHLSERAAELSGRITLALTRVESVEERISKKLLDDKEASTLLTVTKENLKTNTSSMSATLKLMDRLGLDPNLYKAQLAAATRDIGTGLFDTGVAATLMRRAFEIVAKWLKANGPSFITNLLIFICILLVFRVAAGMVHVGLKKAFQASDLNVSRLMRHTIVSWTSKLVMIIGIMVALSQLGISLGPMLAGVGVAGFIVGFALQDTLSNFASGMMILIYQPYDTGDTIDAGGVLGKVRKMSLVSTTLLTFDNQTIIIPNNKIWGDVIKNVTAQKVRRVDMEFGISYSDDIPKAEKIFADILNANDKVLDDPEPMIRLHTLGASSVDFIVRPWVKVDDYWDVYWDINRAVKLRFDEEGLSIPFPQQDVHVYHENQSVKAVE
jgi:small conductance mechanosensitive channel